MLNRHHHPTLISVAANAARRILQVASIVASDSLSSVHSNDMPPTLWPTPVRSAVSIPIDVASTAITHERLTFFDPLPPLAHRFKVSVPLHVHLHNFLLTEYSRHFARLLPSMAYRDIYKVLKSFSHRGFSGPIEALDALCGRLSMEKYSIDSFHVARLNSHAYSSNLSFLTEFGRFNYHHRMVFQQFMKIILQLKEANTPCFDSSSLFVIVGALARVNANMSIRFQNAMAELACAVDLSRVSDFVLATLVRSFAIIDANNKINTGSKQLSKWWKLAAVELNRRRLKPDSYKELTQLFHAIVAVPELKAAVYRESFLFIKDSLRLHIQSPKHRVAATKFHNRVASYLISLGYRPYMEYEYLCPETLYLIDITMRVPSSNKAKTLNIAIECDGELHYTVPLSTSSNRLGRSVLKQRSLELAGWHVLIIHTHAFKQKSVQAQKSAIELLIKEFSSQIGAFVPKLT